MVHQYNPMNQIIQNEIKCLKCGDIIFSDSRHAFVTCSCGNVSVDGGLSYLRRVWKTQEFEERSLSTDREKLKECIKKTESVGYSGIVEIIVENYSTMPIGDLYKNQKLFNILYDAVHLAVNSNRNSFGIVLAIIRAMRDNGVLDMEKFNNGN